jgi:hypothetical protein
MPYYLAVFKRRFAPGEHWSDTDKCTCHDELRRAQAINPRVGHAPTCPQTKVVPPDHSDRRQDWRVGEVWGEDAEAPPTLPTHLELIELPEKPDWGNGDTWDRDQRRLVKWHENKTRVQDLIAHHEAKLAELKALL